MEVILACFWLQSNTRRISLGQIVYDDAGKGSSKMYILELGNNTSNEGSVSIKFSKYTGKCEVRITGDGSRSTTKNLEAIFTDSMIQFTLTKENRESMQIGEICFIEITASEESTFVLRADYDVGRFTLLDDDITVLGTVAPKQVDNYIYSFLATEEKEEEDNIREFALGAQVAG
jgi:hypothetical protein